MLGITKIIDSNGQSVSILHDQEESFDLIRPTLCGSPSFKRLRSIQNSYEFSVCHDHVKWLDDKITLVEIKDKIDSKLLINSSLGWWMRQFGQLYNKSSKMIAKYIRESKLEEILKNDK